MPFVDYLNANKLLKEVNYLKRALASVIRYHDMIQRRQKQHSPQEIEQIGLVDLSLSSIKENDIRVYPLTE